MFIVYYKGNWIFSGSRVHCLDFLKSRYREHVLCDSSGDYIYDYEIKEVI